MEKNSRLSGQLLSVKVLITMFLMMIALAHVVAILQAHSRTQLDREKTITYFRGNPDDPDSLQIPQSYGSMITISHTHTFSQTMMIGLVGFLFILTGLGERIKATGVVIAFFSSLLSNGSPWLIRYVGDGWVLLLEISGAMLIVSFATMFFFILRDVWRKDRVG